MKKTKGVMTRNYNVFFIYLFFLLALSSRSEAQLVPLSTQYYNNQYLGNPAMAGMDDYFKVNLGVLKQMTGTSGAPVTNSLTADYGITKVGIGLNIFRESKSLLNSTRAAVTYAYHLPLRKESVFSKDGDFLHLGLSLGLSFQHINSEDIIGNPDDPSVVKYNEQTAYADGDFGIAYTSAIWNIQLAIPNLRSIIKESSNVSDISIFYFSASRKIGSGEESTSSFVMEPMICFRGVRGFNSLWDVGTNVTLANNIISVMGMYHSQQSFSMGLSVNYNQNLGLSITYSTPTSAIKSYNRTGNLEAGLKLGFR